MNSCKYNNKIWLNQKCSNIGTTFKITSQSVWCTLSSLSTTLTSNNEAELQDVLYKYSQRGRATQYWIASFAVYKENRDLTNLPHTKDAESQQLGFPVIYYQICLPRNILRGRRK